MSGNHQIDQGWQSTNDFDSANFNNQNAKKEQNKEKKENFLDFLSSVQKMSVMEDLTDENFDSNLFTLKETLNGFNHGFKLGLYANVLLVIHVLLAFTFSFKPILSYFDSAFQVTFLYYLPAFIIVGSTILISTVSKFAVGSYTNKAIKTFFMGKLLGSLIIGVAVLVASTFLFDYISSQLPYIYGSDFTFLSMNSTILYDAMITFVDKRSVLYFELSMLLFVSMILPFMVYGLRKYFFTPDNESAYEDY